MRKTFILLMLMIMMLMPGCRNPELSYYKVIRSPEDLSGSKAGAVIGWTGDIFMYDREDISAMRYEDVGNLRLALCYRKIDSAICDYTSARYFESSINGIKILDEPIGREGMCALFNVVPEDNKKLLDDFNRFVADFRSSDEYADYERRVLAADAWGFEEKDIEMTGKGRVIKVAYSMEEIPATWIETDGTPHGYDIEVVKRFANACNYQIEFVPGVSTSNEISIANGLVDMAVGCLSDVWKDDWETDDNIKLSDSYIDMDIVVVVLEEGVKPTVKRLGSNIWGAVTKKYWNA